MKEVTSYAPWCGISIREVEGFNSNGCDGGAKQQYTQKKNTFDAENEI